MIQEKSVSELLDDLQSIVDYCLKPSLLKKRLFVFLNLSILQGLCICGRLAFIELQSLLNLHAMPLRKGMLWRGIYWPEPLWRLSLFFGILWTK